jgi:glucose-1-phosphate cytidylyltransferase
VTLLDTGLETMTGGRIKRTQGIVGDETFMLTYGDGVADIDIGELLTFHKSHGKAITMTSVQPEGRFGALNVENNHQVSHFIEKPPGDGVLINGGFFVCEPKVFDCITEGDATVFERNPLERLAHSRELYAYRHTGFWKCMDTLRDKKQLNDMWNEGKAPWKIW